MFSVKEPELRWGIASWGTAITGYLFTPDLFVFKKHAEERIAEFMAVYEEQGKPEKEGYMFPVLLKISSSICSDDETKIYHDQQSAWLEKKGQAAIRKHATQAEGGV